MGKEKFLSRGQRASSLGKDLRGKWMGCGEFQALSVPAILSADTVATTVSTEGV